MATLRTFTDGIRRLYRRMFRRKEDAALRTTIDLLAQVGPFQGCARGTLRVLAEYVHPRHYRREEFIYYEGDPGLGMYVIQRGTVRLLVEDGDSMAYMLDQLSDGDTFGELALLGDFRRQETAQASIDTHVLGLFSPDLKTLLRRDPRVGAEVLAALGRYTAAQQVHLVRHVAVQEDPVTARRLLSEATDDVNGLA